MSKVHAICKKCTLEFEFDTEGDDGMAFRSPGCQMVFVERCTHCGYANQVIVPYPER
jgi:hypothetical protein